MKHKILYFFDGSAPSEADLAKMLTLTFPVQYRNGHVAATSDVEPCDGVMGAVPANHQHLPNGEEVVAIYRARQVAERNTSAEPKAPEKNSTKKFVDSDGQVPPAAPKVWG